MMIRKNKRNCARIFSTAAGMLAFGLLCSVHSSMHASRPMEKETLEKELFYTMLGLRGGTQRNINTVNRIRDLLRRGANPNIPVPGYRSALEAALSGGSSDRYTKPIVEALLQAGANPSLVVSDSGFTPLMSAAAWATAELVQMLLDAGAEIEVTDKLGRTVFDIAEGRLEDRPSDEAIKILEVLKRESAQKAIEEVGGLE